MDLPSSLEWGVHVPILLGLAQVLKTSSSLPVCQAYCTLKLLPLHLRCSVASLAQAIRMELPFVSVVQLLYGLACCK